ncbi:MAG: type II toxin-antitoxin system HicA family toxin [Erysipelotrichaceae bacterium]|nr:type II toxin-antitoxin system HicA family toxin [Erysipelotrichaceae bacterium]
MERIILSDGWIFKRQIGSHRQYLHPEKSGKVTIPFHPGDLSKTVEYSILKQAGLKEEEDHECSLSRMLFKRRKRLQRYISGYGLSCHSRR